LRRHTQEDVLAETKDEFRGKSLDGVSADGIGELHARCVQYLAYLDGSLHMCPQGRPST